MRPNREIIVIQTALLCRQNAGKLRSSLRKGNLDGNAPEVSVKYTLDTDLVNITAGAIIRENSDRVACYLIVSENKIIQTLPETYMCYDYYDYNHGIASSVFRTLANIQLKSNSAAATQFANNVRDMLRDYKCLTR